MCKKSKKDTSNSFTGVLTYPKQPWIYISDPSDDNSYADALKELIDACRYYNSNDEIYAGSGITPAENLLARLDKWKDERYIGKKAFMIIDQLNRLDFDNRNKIKTASKVRELAIKSGLSFASVNLYKKEGSKESEAKEWGPHHLELNVADLTVKKVAEKVYSWLFTVIPPSDHAYLLTQSKLQVTDKKNYPGYEYCSLGDIKKHPKDAKLQFGVVITSKPAVVPGTQRLHWNVADKTGTANFYFQYRGSSSQETWDWVQALKPGDIRALPRMPSIKIKEPRRVRIAKLPLRSVSFVVSELGLVVKGVGHGLVKFGDMMSMGKSSEWVPREDVTTDSNGKMKKINYAKKFEQESQTRKEKVEKANREISAKIMQKFWEAKKLGVSASEGVEKDEKESLCDKSTLRGSECGDEKGSVLEKEFC